MLRLWLMMISPERQVRGDKEKYERAWSTAEHAEAMCVGPTVAWYAAGTGG